MGVSARTRDGVRLRRFLHYGLRLPGDSQIQADHSKTTATRVLELAADGCGISAPDDCTSTLAAVVISRSRRLRCPTSRRNDVRQSLVADATVAHGRRAAAILEYAPGMVEMDEISSAHQRLSDDHNAVGEVLKQLLTALDSNDVATSHSKLDLLWARLAVHIRAEHLHLFPAVTNRLPDAQVIVDQLRMDHDFFMRELAQAIAILRDLSIDRAAYEAELRAVGDAVRAVEKRLATHNDVEEDEVYRHLGIILTHTEQSDLLARINAELQNRPPRFSEEAWANLL